MADQPSKREHPNNAPGVPMIFPPWFERLQIKYINPLLKPLSKRMPGMGVIRHRGRTSGKDYETIVSPYRKGQVLVVGLAHGKTNWVKNKKDAPSGQCQGAARGHRGPVAAADGAGRREAVGSVRRRHRLRPTGTAR